jgi:phytoene dehydrogenase-like protein
MKTEKSYRVVIIGGGPNGLTCGAYLAKAGVPVLIVERRHETGGGLLTEDFCGARFNLHATYHLLADRMPPHVDFSLEEHGVRYIVPEVQMAFVTPTGESIVFYRDVERTARELDIISPADANAYREMMADFGEMCDKALIPATYAPPAPPLEYLVMLNQTKLGRQLVEISEKAPTEILDAYRFSHPQIRAALLYLSILWGIHPDETGLGYMVPLYVHRMLNAALLKGGSHRLSSALARIFCRFGGDIIDGKEVVGIQVADGKVQGVRLDDGTVIGADIVVSSLPPPMTFSELIGSEHLSEALAISARNWQWEQRSLFGLHMLVRKKPLYRAEDCHPDVGRALITVLGYETEADVIQYARQTADGELPEKAGGHLTCVSESDPSMAPAGMHVLRWEGFAPYSFGNGRDWDMTKEDYATKSIEAIQSHLRIPLELTLRYAYSPLDIERKLTTMRRGSIKHGEYNAVQMGYFRPNDLCSHSRTPVSGLYLCGASSYPGGMITLGPGYLAANAIADDLRINKWWPIPDNLKRARAEGLVP